MEKTKLDEATKITVEHLPRNEQDAYDDISDMSSYTNRPTRIAIL